MNLLDLFSGIGGFSVGGHMAGIQTVGFAEIDPYASSILERHFPEVPNFGDVRNLDCDSLRDFIGVDIISGGFPCTDLSNASKGSHKHLEGEHSGLFWELARIVNEISPSWVVIENVPQVLKYTDIIEQEMFGYEWSHRIFDSQDFGCACRRRRAYLVGHPESGRAEDVLRFTEESGQVVRSRGTEDVLPMLLPWKGGPSLERLSSCLVERKEADAGGVRESDGLSRGMDNKRYLALGNSVTPIIPFWIFTGMQIVEEGERLSL